MSLRIIITHFSLQEFLWVVAKAPIVLEEHVDHLEGINWLVHWNHVSSIVHSKEVKFSVLAHLTCGLSVDEPILVVLLSEPLLILVLGCKSPCFSSSPVADPVL